MAGDFDTGARAQEESLREFREIGDEAGIAIGVHRIAVGAGQEGDLVRARELLDECLAICERRPNPQARRGRVREARHRRVAGRKPGARARVLGGRRRTMRRDRIHVDAGRMPGRAPSPKWPISWGEPSSPGSEHARRSASSESVTTGRLTSLRARAARLVRGARPGGPTAPAGSGARSRPRNREGRSASGRASATRSPRTWPYPSSEFEQGRSSGRSLSLEEAVEYALDERVSGPRRRGTRRGMIVLLAISRRSSCWGPSSRSGWSSGSPSWRSSPGCSGSIAFFTRGISPRLDGHLGLAPPPRSGGGSGRSRSRRPLPSRSARAVAFATSTCIPQTGSIA